MTRIFTIIGMMLTPSYLIACCPCEGSQGARVEELEEEANDYFIFQNIEESGVLSDFWDLLEDESYDV